MASYPIYQFYSELQSYTPAIWRRFQVPGNITMAQLGYIVMTLYEMRANHLFCLTVPIQDNFATFQKAQEDCAAILTSPLGSEGEIKQFDAASQKMKAVLYGQPGERLYLEYDYGDGWEVQLTLEAVTIDKTLPGRMLPRVLEGAGYGLYEYGYELTRRSEALLEREYLDD